MGRRKRRVIKIPKKKLPKIFLCPKCGKESVKVTLNPDKIIALIKCGSCELGGEVSITSTDQPIDAYCKFIDNFYGPK
jgi:transcription elongation factor Elf1